MRLNRTAHQRRPIALTPLIDVVFLLLVFFMLASTFLKHTSLPITAAAPAAQSEALHKTALVNVSAGGAILVNGEPVTFADFAIRLADLQARKVSQVAIALRPGATLGDLAPVLAEVRRHEFDAVRVLP